MSQCCITDEVRASCARFCSDLVSIDQSVLMAFADALDLDDIYSFVFSTEGLSTNRFEKDISFPDWIAEMGFLMIAHGLDFGSGFRPHLHRHRKGMGAWLTIRAGLISMGKVNPLFEAAWLLSLTLSDVQTYFDLATTVEASQDLLQLSIQLHTSIHEFGSQLIARQFRYPGEYVWHCLKQNDFCANSLIRALVADFPLTFDDSYSITVPPSGTPHTVCFYKKAQLVVSEIYMRFYDTHLSNMKGIDQLTAFVDNVVVATMRLTRILLVDEALEKQIQDEIPLVKGSEAEIALRAATLTAVALLVESVNEKYKSDPSHRQLNEQQLCNWLWGCYGKSPSNRAFPRHLTPSTSFY